jgi:hypothetical protein
VELVGTQAERSWVRFPMKSLDFSIDPSFYPVGKGRFFPPGVKRSGREPDHLPPTGAEIKKTRIYTSNFLYVFMA